MKKLFLMLSLVFFSISFVFPTFAANRDNDLFPMSEKEGVYDVPGRPNLKVKVFIHRAKPVKPNPRATPTPVVECPDDDLDSNYFIPAAGWKLPPDFSYSLNVASVPDSVGSNNWPMINTNAFGEWFGNMNSPVNFHPTENTTINRAKLDGKNIISWGRADNSALAVTYTWYYPASGTVAEIDTIMNQKYRWYWNYPGNIMCTDINSYDAQNILTHELGHWFGLDDVYENNFVDNTMYGYGSKGETKKNTLTTGDINGLNAIYN